MNKRIIFNLLKYALAVGLLTWVIWSNWDPAGGNGLKEEWQRHVVEGQPIHYGYLLLAAAIGLTAIVLTFLRWYVLVRAVELPFRVRDAIRLGFLGFFYNTFLPGSVGGDAVKAWYLAKSQARRTVAVATVIMDRAIALWALIWFVALLGAGFWAAGILDGDGSEQSRRIVMTALGHRRRLAVGLGVARPLNAAREPKCSPSVWSDCRAWVGRPPSSGARCGCTAAVRGPSSACWPCPGLDTSVSCSCSTSPR